MRKFIFIFAAAISLAGCSQETRKNPPLASWADNHSKSRILDFVFNAVDPESEGYIEPADRIAVFDNDGTLWTEKPVYNHVFGVFSMFEELVKTDPEILEDSAYMTLNEFIKTNDKRELQFYMKELHEQKYDEIVGQLFGKAFQGMTVEEFAQWNKTFYEGWKHPQLGTSLSNLTYKPMVELISLLQRNDFRVFIFTADEGAFLKLYSEELYNIPPENVFGTATKLDYKEGVLYRTDQGAYLNNWDNKAKLIYQVTGKQPVLAAGNSNGDFHMLQYVNTQEKPHLTILVHHTDSIREFSYDSHTDQVLPYAQENNYLIVDIENDWKQVFNHSRSY